MHAIRIDPSSAVPIWKQIEDAVRSGVASGALPPGEPIPSVRALATDLVVNPATVARAYQRLVDDGILVVRRGEGTFVAERPRTPGKLERARILREGAARYAQVAAVAGADFDQAVEELAAVMNAGRTQARGSKA
jgi:GntR family transcriptional regulator